MPHDTTPMSTIEIARRLEELLRQLDKDAIDTVLPLTQVALSIGTEDADGTPYWVDGIISIRLNGQQDRTRWKSGETPFDQEKTR